MNRFPFLFVCLLLQWQSAFGLEMSVVEQLIANASEGETITIPAGNYFGNLVIDKKISLRADGKVILDGNGVGSVVTIKGVSGVILDGISIQNSGTDHGNEDSGVLTDDSPDFHFINGTITNTLFGVQLRGSADSSVENSTIIGAKLDISRRGDVVKSWHSPRLRILNNKFKYGRDLVIWYSDHSIVTGNQIEESRYGIHYMYANATITANNVIKNCSVGIYVMYGDGMILTNNKIHHSHGPSGYGIGLKETNQFKLVNNIVTENRIGIHSDSSPMNRPKNASERSIIESNRIARNDIGVQFIGRGEGILFTKNDFTDNWMQLNTKGANKVKAEWQTNYWSDYLGVDLQGNGFGSTSYKARGLFNNMVDRFEGFKVFSFGVAILALDFAERLLPWLNDDLKMEDKSPKLTPWFGREQRPFEFKLIFFAIILAGLTLISYRLGKL